MLRVALLFVAIALAALPIQAEDATTHAIAQLKRIAAEEAANYEHLLVRATPIAADAFRNRKWDAVAGELKSAGLTPVEEPGARSWYAVHTCVLLPKAVALKDDAALDLTVMFEVSPAESQTSRSAAPEFDVDDATIGLSVTPLAPLKQVRDEKWFGEGTVMQEALSAWPVADSLLDYPVLESVEMWFGAIPSRYLGDDRQGFRVRLSLLKTPEDTHTRRQLDCSAETSPRGKERQPVGFWMRRDFGPPGDAAGLADDLQRLVKEEKSLHLLLRSATRVVQAAALDREWPDVAKELDGHGLKLLDEDSWQYGMMRRYLAVPKAIRTEGGQDMDLFVWFSTSRETSRTALTREVIYEAYAGLSAKVQMPYAQIISESRFGKDSAIHKALLAEDARAAAKEYAFLHSVDVNY